MEKTVKFEQYKLVKEHALAAVQAAGVSLPEAGSMNPVLLAYVGDVVFSLYVRLRFLAASSHVRVIHDLSSKAVSAVYQAKALAALMDTLNEQELAAVKRGRNTKSSVPKSASVHEYRMSTAFEALIGWLFLNNEDERLEKLWNRLLISLLMILRQNEVKYAGKISKAYARTGKDSCHERASLLFSYRCGAA